VSTFAWFLAAVDVLAVAAIAVSRWRKAGRTYDAILAEFPPPPSPDEVAGLVGILTAASKPGASMADIALAVLSANYRQRRGGSR
jgi:hypothetical protein